MARNSGQWGGEQHAAFLSGAGGEGSSRPDINVTTVDSIGSPAPEVRGAPHKYAALPSYHAFGTDGEPAFYELFKESPYRKGKPFEFKAELYALNSDYVILWMREYYSYNQALGELIAIMDGAEPPSGDVEDIAEIYRRYLDTSHWNRGECLRVSIERGC